MKCQAITQGFSVYPGQCSNEGKHEISGEIVGWRDEHQADHTAHLCKLHVNQLDRHGRLSIYTDGKEAGWQKREIGKFRPKDRSVYEERLWVERYETARMGAYRKVESCKGMIELDARHYIDDFIALVADGTPIPAMTRENLRTAIQNGRAKLATAKAEYKRLCNMTMEDYRAEREKQDG